MGPASKRSRFPWPALVLFFLSPVVGELLSSASLPVEFFSVFGLTVMSVLYGSGALLVREACVRWGAGWPDPRELPFFLFAATCTVLFFALN